MNKKEIAETVRAEVWELEALIKKLQTRSDSLKSLATDLEEEIAGPAARNQKPARDSKFRKAIDLVFGEKPRRHKR